MYTEEEIKELVKKEIDKKTKPGTHTGGSGHLANVSYTIDEVLSKVLPDGCTEVNYKYTIYIETEFTYYPDNPPHEEHYNGMMILNEM